MSGKELVRLSWCSLAWRRIGAEMQVTPEANRITES